MEISNYYKLLGVSRHASIEEIKRIYKELALLYHPDSNFYDEILKDAKPDEGIDKFKEITAAYNVLIDTEKRKKYDQELGAEVMGWESEVNLRIPPDELLRLKQDADRKRQNYAYGTFGKDIAKPSVLSEMVSEVHIRPMSEMIDIRQGLWAKLLRFFGIKKRR